MFVEKVEGSLGGGAILDGGLGVLEHGELLLDGGDEAVAYGRELADAVAERGQVLLVASGDVVGGLLLKLRLAGGGIVKLLHWQTNK